MTSFENVQQVLDNFDFDYISVALYKNKIYGEKEASPSWKEKYYYVKQPIFIDIAL